MITQKSALSPFAPPGTAEYTEATASYNVSAQPAPRGALVARTTRDVVRAVRAADRLGLGLFVQATGHSAGSAAPMDDGLLVRTGFDAPVRIDVERRIATIPAGARWDDVVTLAQEHGLAAAHGSSGTVGTVGYLVRGGMSFYGRQVGLAANLVRSISVVLASGELVRATANEHAGLFWALRGGDGGFGVVTQIEVSLFPMAQVITGGIFWSAEYAEPILEGWQQWCRTAPERASTSMRLLNLPPLPRIPDQIAGRPVIGLDGAVSVPQESDLASGLRILDQMLAPLRAVALPLLDTWAPKRPADLLLTHLDPPQPLIYQNDHFLLGDLGSDGIEALVAAAGPASGSNLLVVELRQLGGAFATGSAEGGVVDHLDAAYAYLALGVPSPVASAEDNNAQMARLRSALKAWDTGYTSPTFVDNYHQPQRSFDDVTAARVAGVRAEVDPWGLFRGGVAPIRDSASINTEPASTTPTQFSRLMARLNSQFTMNATVGPTLRCGLR